MARMALPLRAFGLRMVPARMIHYAVPATEGGGREWVSDCAAVGAGTYGRSGRLRSPSARMLRRAARTRVSGNRVLQIFAGAIDKQKISLAHRIAK